MTVQELRTELAAVLGVPVSELSDTATPETVASWDSVAALQIISYLDGKLGVSVEPDELALLNSFASIARFARVRGLLKG